MPKNHSSEKTTVNSSSDFFYLPSYTKFYIYKMISYLSILYIIYLLPVMEDQNLVPLHTTHTVPLLIFPI